MVTIYWALGGENNSISKLSGGQLSSQSHPQSSLRKILTGVGRMLFKY